MPKYVVVPQAVVDALAPALSSDPNIGAQMAEQICRTEEGGTLMQKIQAGVKLSALEKAQLPELRQGHSWDEVAELIILPKEGA